ncbi:MAG: hypothetical protein IJC78_07755 [Clostridia bacterium]|nr:hypothetical protein [Clostridia bacterium]
MTVKLYDKDAYIKEFTATVLSCEETDGAYQVVLDETAFFPEGGGQPADTGTLGEVNVKDVQEEKGIIVHITDGALPVGEKVSGKLNWDIRYSRMQSHAGEHIVAGTVHTMFGYDNVGFHLNDSFMTVDVSGPLTKEDIGRIELAANKAIYQNNAITVTFPSTEEVAALEYRSKLDITEGLRIVTIENVDCCACCAPHPKSTGEIGAIKILDFYPNKGGTRMEMVAGLNAYLDYKKLHEANKTLMKLLSAARDEVAETVEKLNEQLQQLRGENQRLSKELALSAMAPVAVGDSAYVISEGLSYDELRHCSNSLTEQGFKNCILLSRSEESSYIYVVSSSENEAKEKVSALNEAFSGKGGGKPNYAQGKITVEDVDAAKSLLEKLLQ